MKHQYFGDINDYRKYGILRQLAAARLSIGVCWMRTANDRGRDGRKIQYLHQPEKWRPHDPALFDHLHELVVTRRRKNVNAVQERGLISGACYAPALLTSHPARRTKYMHHMQAWASASNLVFFDPDNGLEVASCPVASPNACKYLYWNELPPFWKAGKSLLIYQHFPRVERRAYLSGLAKRLRQGLADGPPMTALITSHVAFLLVGQAAHSRALAQGLAGVEQAWSGQIALATFE